MKKVSVILVGAGGRGKTYTNVMAAYPEKFQVVGVADPIEDAREYIRKKHNVSADNCFETWEDILNRPKMADVAIIGTQDNMHYEPALKALELGYDLLLEKPAAQTAEECYGIWKQAKHYDRKVMVCHVLRYTPFYSKVKELIKADKVGDIISITHTEGVGNLHQSHSFVRGHWGNQEKSNFMLLAKSCHDVDLLQWLMDKKCSRIQSFGSLNYFRKECAPEGAPEYCIEGCPNADTCCYNAVKLYLDDKENMWFRTTSTGLVDPTDEDVTNALTYTQYGKCVYKCDNDVVDHQVVNMEFEDKSTVAFTMCAFNKGGRTSNIMGTKGEMILDFEGDEIKLYQFATGEMEIIHSQDGPVDGTIVGGHGGGDDGLVDALYDYLTGVKTAEEVSEIGISCVNHLLVFAAEHARLTNTIVEMDEFKKMIGESNNL